MESYITLIGSILTIGLFLDKVLLTEDRRKELVKFLQAGENQTSFYIEYRKIIGASKEIVFDRFFGESFLSAKFIFSALFLSIASLLIVASIQYAIHGLKDIKIELEAIQISIFLGAIFFNIIIDYLSIVQTKIFVDAAIRSESAFRSVVIIIFDFICSINIFIFIFSAFIMSLIYFSISSPEKITIQTISSEQFFSDIRDNEAQILSIDDGNADKISSKGQVSFDISSDTGERGAILRHLSTEDNFSADTIIKLIELNLYFDFLTESTNVEISKLPDDANEIERFFSEGQEIVKTSIIGTLIPKDFTLSQSNLTYTAAFSFVDRMEDEFPMSVSHNLSLISIRDLLNEAARGSVRWMSIGICRGAAAEGQIIFDPQYPAPCESFDIFSNSVAFGFFDRLSLSGREYSKLYSPENTMFITSIAPTIFFYFVIILVSVLRFLVYSIANRFSAASDFISRSPLAISAFVFGHIVFLFL